MIYNMIMENNLNKINKIYWQNYKPGEIPSTYNDISHEIFENVNGPILDVGTGDGILAESLASNGFDVYGIDIAKNIIKENTSKATKVKYSVQDISEKTNFPNNFFNLIIFKFTLTNIHKESWENVSNEVFRILKPNGKLLIIEPLVSPSYQLRYDLASNFIKDPHCLYVFKDKDLAKHIKTLEELEQTIDNNQVSRIVKHYTVEEIKTIFNKLDIIDHIILNISSPSGYDINTFEGIFIKDNQ